jgi:hypothetical protein
MHQSKNYQKKKKSKIWKTDKWNERSKNREERLTKNEDAHWNKKEDEEKGEYENELE